MTARTVRLVIDTPTDPSVLSALSRGIESVWPGSQMVTTSDGDGTTLAYAIALDGTQETPGQHEVDGVGPAGSVDLGDGTEVQMLTAEKAKVTPPEGALNIVAGYVLAITESLPDGVTSVTQEVGVPGTDQRFRLDLTPATPMGGVAATWSEDDGWTFRERSYAEALRAARSKERERVMVLRQVMALKNISGALRARVRAALR